MSEVKKRGPYAKTQLRRLAISDAALAIVIESGHSSVSAATVADRAGVSEKTVSYHFPTRDHLLVSALAAADAATSKIFAKFHLETRGVSDFLKLQASTVSGHPNRLSLYISQAANVRNEDHPAHAWFLEHQANAHLYFSQTLRRDQDAGTAHQDIDSEQFAIQMTALWDGLQIQKLLDPAVDLTAAVMDGYRRLARTDLLEARRALTLLAADI